MAVEIDCHRWYAVIKEDDKVVGVVGVDPSARDLSVYELMEEWENSL
jgi:hypothetical protein